MPEIIVHTIDCTIFRFRFYHSVDQLAMLIRETADRGVEFIYALSPGLDIVFSSDKDVDALKKKLEQVKYGCSC